MKNKTRTKSTNKKQVKAVKKEIPPSQKSLLSKQNEETGKNKPGLKDFATLKKRSTKPRNSRYAEKYWDILENIQDGCFEVDLPGNFTFLNDSVCRALGYSREELMKMNVRQLSDKETLKKVFQATNEVYKTGKPIKEFDWQVTRKDGAERYIQGSISLRKDSSGNPIGFLVIANDITERKRMEEKLRNDQQELHAIMDASPIAVSWSDMQGNIKYINSKFQEIFGYTVEEIPNIDTWLLLAYPSPAYREHVLSLASMFIEAQTQGKEVSPAEVNVVCKNGSIRHVLQTPLLTSNRILIIYYDITEHKRMEEIIRENEKQYRTFFNTSRDCVFITSIDGRLVDMNDAAVELSGYSSRNELMQVSIPDLYAKDEERTKHINTIIEKGYSKDYPVDMRRKDGEVINTLITSNVRYDAAGKVIGFMGTIKDITERKKAEEQLHQTLDKLKKAVGMTIQVLVSAVESRDPYTSGHQSRSANLACAIATEMGLPQDKIEGIHMAGIIHDIGKLSIPAEILSKPTKLTNIEFTLIKQHSLSGYEMLKDVESPWPLAEIVQQHHERINGSGYPRNLKEDEILLEARILAVADVVEAMASHRPYRPTLGIEAALEEIEKNKGILYDDAVADACLKLFREKGYQLA